MVKIIKKTLLLFAITLYIAVESRAQENQVDSLNFSTEKGLLIFEGYLNGVKTDFAFDTGASSGVLNSKNVKDSGIQIKGSRKINDSQRKLAKLELGKITTLKIGAFNFSNPVSVVTDMPFLYCNNLYLLGGDIINQLNWKFDFSKNRVYFSKQPFTPQIDMHELPFKILGNRHFSSITAGGVSIENVLIDFGFAGSCTLDTRIITTKTLMSKTPPENIYLSKSSSMGLNSMSVGKTTSSFFLDSVVFGGVLVNNFKINAMADTHDKVGLLFFQRNFDAIIINNSELKYWLRPGNIQSQKQTSFDASFHLNEKGKIEVVSLNGSKNHSAQSLSIGEQVMEVNGRRADSFADNCEFLSWYAGQAKKESFSVTTIKGEKLTIGKSVF